MSTPNHNNPPLIVPDDAVWYVKTGLDRAMRDARNSIERSQRYLSKLQTKLTDPNTDQTTKTYLPTLIAETTFTMSHYEQWLNEAREAYRTLPKKLQPLALTEDD